MSLSSFLYRERRWLRHNGAALALVLIVLPSLFAVSTVAFQQVIPRDTPVAVVPGSDAVTENEVEAIEGVSALFSRPHSYDSRDAAERALAREEVYAVFVVPHGLFEDDGSVTIEMVAQEEMVPYEQPSVAISTLLTRQVGSAFPADVSVERTTVGEDRTLSEFLVSAGAVLLTMLYAFLYLPRVVAGEQSVFRRVRVESSLSRLLAAKFAVFTPLMVVPLLVFQGVVEYLDFEVALLAPAALGVTLLTFVSLAAISLGVMFFLRFRTVGRLVNAALLFALLAFGSLVYPAGFFSPLRRAVARSIPVHHAMIVQRGISLKGHSAGMYADRFALLAAFAVGALAFLASGVAYYQRRA